ncbi:MAG: hypothetical protein CL833_01720 [Crocinitomicaceae bacterium]|nr:hypothetical protein [Crocinitomicaceae bacterium]
MKAIVPAKDNSIRIPHKNYIEFHDGKSLVDITIEKLLKVIPSEDIYLSCENAARSSVAKRWGINFILRDEELTHNDTDFYDVFNGICDQVPGDDDIAWCQVIDPLFNEYQECFDAWRNGVETLECGAWATKQIRKYHDSLVVVYPQKHYTLDSRYNPQGFGFHRCHVKSQDLPISYQLTFCFSILKRSSVKSVGYYVGEKPYWFNTRRPRIDIDSKSDFELASILYRYYNE